MRSPRVSLALALALVTVLALPATGRPGHPPQAAQAAPQDHLTAPEGGPVDDGWLPGPDGPAFAQFAGEPTPGGGPIWPGLMYEVRRTTLADGKGVDVQLLHTGPGEGIQVRPTLAHGTVRGVATVAQQSGDPLTGTVAAVNGGFWLRSPYGEPNGLFAIDGRLVSDAESQGAGPRGAVGWTADGRVLIDRIDSVETVTLADGHTLTVAGLNRDRREYDELFSDGDDALLAYTSDFGGPIVVRQPEQPPPPEPDPDETGEGSSPPPIPGDPQPSPTPPPPPEPDPIDLAVVRMQVPIWPASGALSGVVTGISRDTEATFTANPGEVLLVASGAEATALDVVEVGDVLTVATTLTARDTQRDGDWTTVAHALAGGPMVVKDGRPTAATDWVEEGFEPHVHSDVRAPRTAIGVTAEGRTLVVTADGRRPGITHGFTIQELADYMIALGAVEALSLDGGGSSQMVVDGVLRNVPCCDTTTRGVATSLQFTHDYTFSSTQRLQGGGRVDTAAAIARTMYPQGSPVALLAVAGSFPDALAGGPLATALGGPVLLTETAVVPTATSAALADLGVRSVRLLGGEAVIGPEVVESLQTAGFTVDRVAGGSRFDTAAAIAEEVAATGVAGGDGISRAFLVPGGTFADALVAAGPGGMLGMPVLLTPDDGLHPAARGILAGVDEVVVVDGDGVLSPSVIAEVEGLGVRVTRFGGLGRYAVAGEVNDWLAAQVPLAEQVIVARGDAFPDALAGGPLAAARLTPLMLVPPGSIDADPRAAAWFTATADRGGIRSATILGGLAAVGSYSQWQLDQLVARAG